MVQKILLAGRPNVGKSSLFNCLSNTYATVSNYPGTTVGVTRGEYKSASGVKTPILDLPGMYHFVPITEEEKVASLALLGVKDKVMTATKEEASCCHVDDTVMVGDALILHVVEASKLPVHLPFTCLLKNLGKPLILVVNMSDEARAKKIDINYQKLEERLGIPVVAISAVSKEGIDILKRRIDHVLQNGLPVTKANWPSDMFDTLETQHKEILQNYESKCKLSIELLWMNLLEGGDLKDLCNETIQLDVEKLQNDFAAKHQNRAQVYFYSFFKLQADALLQGIFTVENKLIAFREKLSNLMIRPWFGVPLLLLILYLGIYEFVGVFGAGTVVGWFEENLFGEYITPYVVKFFNYFFAEDSVWSKLFVGDYGLFTLGITYAFALVLPVVFFFFLVFSMIEDSGYFPRLALLIDRVFKIIGLNGRAVIPMVLGLGCDTMATITTRTLETKRERIIATFLLALAVPCSAQLGLVTGLMSKLGILFWFAYVGIILFILFLFGFMSKIVLKGESALFFMELPPLRLPRISNVLIKSFSRMKWYLIEVVPLFLYASVLLWLLDISGGIEVLQQIVTPLMHFIGLPSSAAESFLVGFFRRDFGAAGLFKLALEHTDDGVPILSSGQILVGAVTLTLFVPCIAQFMIMWKERGPKVATVLLVTITTIAFLSGKAVLLVLQFGGIK